MLIFEIVMVAMGAVRANFLRSALTTLGIVIGIAAVITMVALGEGAQQQVQAEINRMGTTVLTIRPGQMRMGGVSRGDAEMSIDDAIALRAEAGEFIKVSPEQQTSLQISYMRWNARTQINGVWPEYFDIYDIDLSQRSKRNTCTIKNLCNVARESLKIWPAISSIFFTNPGEI
jgi:putative ABC transport system permease protein